MFAFKGKAKKDQKEQLEEALESSQDEADLQEEDLAVLVGDKIYYTLHYYHLNKIMKN